MIVSLILISCVESYPIVPKNYFSDRVDSDYDGDGYSEEEGDCDDQNVLRSPGNDEVCDGIDNNCDADELIDENAIDAHIFYRDDDNDSFGVQNDFVNSCEITVAGYVLENELSLYDCLDTDGSVFPGNAINEENYYGCFLDTDNDNWGDKSATEIYDVGTDCDDSDPNIYTGAAPFEDSGACVRDYDGDGFGDINALPPFDAGQDCDDSNLNANPNSIEVCDEIDNNCDGVVDEDGAIGAPTWYADIDSDGFGNALYSIQRCASESPEGYTSNGLDCDDYLGTVFPGANEVCNLIDEDCDGEIDEGVELVFYEDVDGDGFGNSIITTEACTVPTGYAELGSDCDDDDASQNPSEEESCYNYEDDDCDGMVDEDDSYNATQWYPDLDGDSFGDPSAFVLACLAPQSHVANDEDCDDNNPSIKPLAPEYCNGIDDNCDGLIDDPSALDIQTFYVDADGDGYGNFFLALDSCPIQDPSGELPPSGYSSIPDDCNDNDANISPAHVELCDTIDQNCDGDSQLGAIDPIVWYVDSDGDGYGNENISFVSCEAPYGFVSITGDCNDFESTTFPDAVEYCNGKLDDCNLAEDLYFSPRAVEIDNDGDGYIECAYDPLLWVDINDIPAGGDDCDDTRASVYPNAPTLCDGRYNACEDVLAFPNAIPEDEADLDNDGYVVCFYDELNWDGDMSIIGGYDCDDANDFIHPFAAELENDAYLCVQDMDEDGYADCGQMQSCDSGLFLTTDIAIDFMLIPSGVDPYNEYEISNSFLMSATEITQDTFLEVMGFNPAYWNLCGGDCPIEDISYSTAADFTNALSTRHGLSECYECTGVASARYCDTHPDYTNVNNSSIYECPGYRLPTSAEWRYACLAGTTHHYWTNNGGGSSQGQNNYILNDGSDLNDYGEWGDQPSPVATYLPNGYGIYDLHGNVWEYHHDTVTNTFVGLDPVFEDGNHTLASGSSYYSNKDSGGGGLISHCTNRDATNNPQRDSIFNHVGFRIVQSQP